MYCKSAIIHKNRVLPYFQNKIEKLNNIIIIIIIRRRRRKIIKTKRIKKKIYTAVKWY